LYAIVSGALGEARPAVADDLYDLFIRDDSREALLARGQQVRARAGDTLCREIVQLLDIIDRGLSPTDIGLRMQLAEFTRRREFLKSSPMVQDESHTPIGVAKPDRVSPGDREIHLPGNCLAKILVKVLGTPERDTVIRALSHLDLEIIDGRACFSSATEALKVSDTFLSRYEQDRLFVRPEGEGRWHIAYLASGEPVPGGYRPLRPARKEIKYGHKLG
jgi:hypothetical protein